MSTLEQAPHRPPARSKPMSWSTTGAWWPTPFAGSCDRGGQVYYLHNRTETIDRTAAKLRALLGRVGPHRHRPWKNGPGAVGRHHEPDDRRGAGHPGVHHHHRDGHRPAQREHPYHRKCRDLRPGPAPPAPGPGGSLHPPGRRLPHLSTRSKVLTEDQSKRLSAIREYAAFGSGLKIAMRDLEIRGAGNLLGARTVRVPHERGVRPLPAPAGGGGAGGAGQARAYGRPFVLRTSP